MRVPAALLLSSVLLTAGEQITFTSRTAMDCPLVVSATSSSSEYGFSSALIANDGPVEIRSATLRVTFAIGGSSEDVIDAGHVILELPPGAAKRFPLTLAPRLRLQERAQRAGEGIARVVLSVEAVEFANGMRWESGEPVHGVPINPPARPK